jgi:serine/threonine protein kinase
VCENKPYDEKSDIWALGVILYEMTTLNRPFEGKNLEELIEKISKIKPKSIHFNYTKDLSKMV